VAVGVAVAVEVAVGVAVAVEVAVVVAVAVEVAVAVGVAVAVAVDVAVAVAVGVGVAVTPGVAVAVAVEVAVGVAAVGGFMGTAPIAQSSDTVQDIVTVPPPASVLPAPVTLLSPGPPATVSCHCWVCSAPTVTPADVCMVTVS
jgi:hypothetical protein